MSRDPRPAPELVCPAGTPAALRAAVDAGADAVYCGFQDKTNARNFPGLNFSRREMAQGIAYAHDRSAKVLLAINTFPPAGETELWKRAVDDAAEFGADAVILADMGLARYAAARRPGLRRHLSVQAGASSPEAIGFYCTEFGIARVVLPRMLTVPEIADLHRQIPCEIEVFVFGNIGMMAEGRCSLTNYLTGQSTNMDGVCSPPSHVTFDEDGDRVLTVRMSGHVIDCVDCGQSAGYPTICKGRYVADRSAPYYAFEEPVSLNLTALLPDLIAAGVSALKIEGRQRSRAYVATIVAAYRRAIDACVSGGEPEMTDLVFLTEGGRETQGAFHSKKWR